MYQDTLPITVVLAATPDGEIGYKNTIPWKLEGDLRRFRQITKVENSWLIMGRKTYESLPMVMDGRNVIVLTKSLGPVNTDRTNMVGFDKIVKKTTGKFGETIYQANGLVTALGFIIDQPSSMEYINGTPVVHPPKVFVVGGANVYATALAAADTVELTLVYKKPNFPLSPEDLVQGTDSIQTAMGKLTPKTYDAVIPDFQQLMEDFQCTKTETVGMGTPRHGLMGVSHLWQTYTRKPKHDLTNTPEAQE